MAMNTRVTAEAWIKVSRSGHWTRFSSAQQETMNPITGPRRRSGASATVRRRFSDSLRRRSRSFSSRRRSRRLIRSGAAATGAALRSQVEFTLGESVKVTSGPLSDFDGEIVDVNADQQKLKVLVDIFERQVPVELAFDQVKKLD